MGETGCGKTRLIRYMCDLAKQDMEGKNLLTLKASSCKDFRMDIAFCLVGTLVSIMLSITVLLYRYIEEQQKMM